MSLLVQVQVMAWNKVVKILVMILYGITKLWADAWCIFKYFIGETFLIKIKTNLYIFDLGAIDGYKTIQGVQ